MLTAGCGQKNASVENAASLDDLNRALSVLAMQLGFTDVACFGSKFYETPNIDRMAASGIRFTSGREHGAIT
jgi:hypothetical protein